MIEKKSLFKHISIFFVIVGILILSIFSLFKPRLEYVSAASTDSTVQEFTFIGSDIIVPCTSVKYGSYNSITFDRYCFAKVNITFSFSTNNLYSFHITGGIDAELTNTHSLAIPFSAFSLSGLSARDSDLFSLSIARDNAYRVECSYYIYGNLTNSINRVRLFNTHDGGNYANCIRYYDEFSNYIEFKFYSWDTDSNSTFFSRYFAFTDRTYYLSLNFTDNNIYEMGYDQGVTDGYNDGYSAGLEDNQSNVFNNGYNVGYETGLIESGNYSFASLFGAVLDAPVKTFTGLLNFELLGVNLLGLVTGLFTLAVIIIIIKMCLGGK